jgi:hypothetical protein
MRDRNVNRGRKRVCCSLRRTCINHMASVSWLVSPECRSGLRLLAEVKMETLITNRDFTPAFDVSPFATARISSIRWGYSPALHIGLLSGTQVDDGRVSTSCMATSSEHTAPDRPRHRHHRTNSRVARIGPTTPTHVGDKGDQSPEGAWSAYKRANGPTATCRSGIQSTDPAKDRPTVSGRQRIRVRCKAQRLSLPRAEAQESRNGS